MLRYGQDEDNNSADTMVILEDDENTIRVLHYIDDMRRLREEWREKGCSVGLVPTMGNLHRGHTSLLKTARTENDIVVLSILITPRLFDNQQQYRNFPKNIDSDIKKAEALEVDALFLPEFSAMFSKGFISYVEPADLSLRLEGLHRPGYFRDCATSLLKLINIVEPDNAYFGQKNIQQFIVAKRMIQDLNLRTKMHCLPIVREQSGLLVSHANDGLNEEQARQALFVNKALLLAEAMYQNGERSSAVILAAMEKELRKALLGAIEYLQIVDMEHLLPMERIKSPALLAISISFGDMRLVDNTILK